MRIIGVRDGVTTLNGEDEHSLPKKEVSSIEDDYNGCHRLRRVAH
jgi:hypothetical protein